MDVSLSPGSAIEGQDFLFNDTTVTFPAFSLDTQAVWVTIIDNNIYQANKQANFSLSNVTNGAVLGISAFTLTIINNDSLAGISQTGFDNICKVFPNPVSNKLMVQTSVDITSVEITDVIGNRLANLAIYLLVQVV